MVTATTDNVALVARDLFKRYRMAGKAIDVLRGIDLTVRSGEWVMLSGHSGSGKTTLLHLLGLLDTPDRGEIRYFDHTTTGLRATALAQMRRQRLGFIFQSYHLFQELSAEENVVLSGLVAGVSRRKAAERARSLLATLGIDNRLYHRPNELSGGEQQRVAVARALMNEPDVLLADEPTGNLDTDNSREIMEILRKLRDDERKTIIMVTHDMTLAHYADHMYRLDAGKLVVD